MGAKISKIDRKGKGKAQIIHDDDFYSCISRNVHTNFISFTSLLLDASDRKMIDMKKNVQATNFDCFDRDPTGGGCW